MERHFFMISRALNARKRKIFALLFALVASIGLSWAGELTVADGTKSNNCVPYDGYSGDYFQRVQIIYPQSELLEMAGKDITSLTFYVNSQASSALGVKVQIGLAEISDSDFSAGKDYKSATLTIVKAEDVWDLNAATVVVEFSEPFSYSGEGNILFDLQTVAKGGYGNTSFYGVGSFANYQSAYSYNESSIPATSSNRYKFIPKTTFTYEEPAPTTYTLQLVADPEKGSVAVTNLLGSDIIDNGNGNYTVPENAEVTILATPLEGYEFTGWKAGDISCDFLDCGVALNTLDNPMTIGIGRDVALMAEFAAVAPTPATTTVTWDISTLSSIGLLQDGDSFTKDGVTLTAPLGIVEQSNGYWSGPSDEDAFKFSTSLGNFTKIEISAGEIVVLGGSGWTQTSPGAVWTGDANETTCGGYFLNVTQIVFTIEPAATPEPEPQQGIVCTAEDLDKVLCSDGSIYENVAAATAAGKTAVAMIASINTTDNKVVAIALADEAGTMDWETAQSTCAAKTAVAGVAWTALSLDQIFGILEAHNGGEFGYYADLNTTIANVGGTSILTQIEYWTKDEFKTTDGVCFHFDTDEDFIAAGFVEKATTLSVRACLEFDLTVSGGGSEPAPAGQVITWDFGFCSGVMARRDEGEYLAWDNSKDGITVTYGGSDDYDGIEGGYIELYGSSESKMIFSSTVGDISKIEVYYISNEGSAPADWTLDATNSKFVWEGTPAASVDMKKGDAQFISFAVDHIVFTVESQGVTTAVENVQTNQVQATKFFRDGQLLIEKNGKTYTVQGVEVK